MVVLSCDTSTLFRHMSSEDVRVSSCTCDFVFQLCELGVVYAIFSYNTCWKIRIKGFPHCCMLLTSVLKQIYWRNDNGFEMLLRWHEHCVHHGRLTAVTALVLRHRKDFIPAIYLQNFHQHGVRTKSNEWNVVSYSVMVCVTTPYNSFSEPMRARVVW